MIRRHWKKITAALTALSLIAGFVHFYPSDLPQPDEQALALGGTNVPIRQEINIFNRYWNVATSTNATSSELIYIDSTKYSGTISFYFEAVASTSVSFSRDLVLKNATSGAEWCRLTIPAGSTSMTLTRSSACATPTAIGSYFVVATSSASGATSIKAARVVIAQSFADTTVNATSTQTQIEIGSYINASTSSSTATGADPKYWKYDAGTWDASPTFSVQVSFQNTQVTSASDVYTTYGNTTVTSPAGATHAIVELWGAGGGGRCSASTQGGSGGAGGTYTRSTTTTSQGTSNTVFIPNGGKCSVTAATSSATWNTNQVTAVSGAGSNGNAVIATTSSASNVGQVKYDGGGSGAAVGTNDTGGGGGGAGGPLGKGLSGNNAVAASGGSGGAGNNGSGGAGGAGSGSGNGSSGTSNVEGGGGGGGSFTTLQGGAGGAPGGGGGGGDTTQTGTNANGGRGQARIGWIYGTANFALQEDDGSFANWTAVVASSSYSTTTSSLFTLGSFNPTDGRHYRLVASTTGTSTTYSIFNAKIVVNQSGTDIPGETIGYDVSNQSGSASMWAASRTGIGESFNTLGGKLTNVGFWMYKGGSPTGNASVSIYAHTGTFGVDGTPTGSALATSDSVDVTTFVTNPSFEFVDFTFSGINQINLTDGTPYFAVLEWSGGDASNYIALMQDSTPAYDGNRVVYLSPTWTADTSFDIVFSATTTVATQPKPTLLEPQYLLANTSLNSGTSLQNALTKWDSSEWGSDTQLFYHQVDSGPSSGSSVGLYTTGDVLVASSTVSSPNRQATSTKCMTMPSNGNIDTKATTNNGDIYASRVLVRVNLAGGLSCSGGGGGSPPSTEIYIEDVYFMQ